MFPSEEAANDNARKEAAYDGVRSLEQRLAQLSAEDTRQVLYSTQRYRSLRQGGSCWLPKLLLLVLPLLLLM